ncbi:hypothetical protein, partial [Rhodococcoides corynebacterioides]|uniref:hypothetical protein n=1 Tax=Rhodococcoides corynebacterioides TaxID=53972 RepID=UPI003ADB156D
MLDLNLFPSDATDYTVTWKQAIAGPAAGRDYKNGMLLRGTSPVGNATNGYVQGLKQGYLFIAYNVGVTNTAFRIYRSTSAVSASALSQLVSTNAALVPTAGQPIWYRASTTGTTSVLLKFEYSLDSLT